MLDELTQFAGLLNHLPVAVFVVDRSGRPCYANDASLRLLGKGIHPDAASDQLAQTYGAYIAGTDEKYPVARMPIVRALAGEVSSVDDMEIRHPDRTVVIEVHARPIRDNNGEIRYAVATFTDITARKRAEEDARKKSSFVRLLEVAAVAANEAQSFEGALQTAIDEICAHTGWPVGHVYVPDEDTSDRMLPTKIWHLEDPRRFDAFRRVTEATTLDPGRGLVGGAVLTKKPSWIQDVTEDPGFIRARFAKETGIKTAMAFPVLAATEVVAVIEFFSNESTDPDPALLEVLSHVGIQLGRVVERRRMEDDVTRWALELHEQTLVDDLTGVSNRRGFVSVAEHQLKVADRTRRPLHVLFVDIDNMKEVNDTGGHAQGDAALRDAARILRETFRRSDAIARIGGDEFAILLPETDRDGARRALHHLRDAVERHNAKNASRYTLSLSVGLQSYDPERPCALDELLRRADEAMYREKSKGKEVSVSARVNTSLKDPPSPNTT